MEKFSNSVAIITGASAGIGKEICLRLLAEAPPTLVVVGLARRPISIEHENFHAFECDISDPDQIENTIEKIQKKFEKLKISILVNNAGHAKPLPLLDDGALRDNGTVVTKSLKEAAEIYKSMLDVNVLGLTLVTRQVSKFLDHSICGNIININSMSGHRVVNSINTHFYSATKYAVSSLTEGVRQELRRLDSNIRVSQISPGFVDTEFFGQVSQNEKYLENMKEIAKTALSASDIADAVLLCLKAPPSCQIGDVQMRPTIQKT